MKTKIDVFSVDELSSTISKLWAFKHNFYVNQVFNNKISILMISSLQRVRPYFILFGLKEEIV